ncbi:MAG: Dabb family protein [Dysgonamonadaceae bacterium]|jgi:hypothetical protein|nr:Dabb family protein [Dysgonamonadaceae bacterium]
MVKHIVLFKLADKAEGNSKLRNAEIIKERLENLKNSIPQIRKIHVHINAQDAPDGNYDTILDTEFDNMDDVKSYAVHPDHLKAVEFITKVRVSRAAIDYEF